MRLTVRVKPGSSRTAVGGRFGAAEPPVLLVAVAAPAADGRANEALLAALAAAFGLRRSAVRLVSGATSRTKVVDAHGADPRVLGTLLTR
jgi:uncharacterized protein YggU (UPF0235/DUF167 family)